MNLQLSGKTALVTGASSVGIGRAIALALAAEGVKLCITSRRATLLEEVAETIAAVGATAPSVIVRNLMEQGAAERLARESLTALGRIDILVNCAGVGAPRIGVDGPADEWHEMMTLNFDRVRELTHAVLPGMISNRWGRIINISGKSELKGLFSTLSAKAALHVWSKGISAEVGRYGITCNCIAPGRIMSEQIRRKYDENFRADHSAREIPVGRYGEPEELAYLAVCLASPLASYITGTIIPVDGGLRHYAF